MASTTYLDKWLKNTTYVRRLATGYESNDFVAERILPRILVDSDVFLIPKTGKEKFYNVDTKRAVGSLPKGVSGSIIESEEKYLDYHALTVQIDEQVINRVSQADTNGAAFDLMDYETETLIHRMMQFQEEEVSIMLQDPNNYDADLKNVLTSGNGWGEVDVNPIKHIDAAIAAMREKGVKANTITFAYDSWELFRTNPNVIAEIYGAVAERSFIDEQKVIDYFKDITDVIIADSIKVDEETGVTSQFWTDTCIVSYKTGENFTNGTVVAPAGGYTFVDKNNQATKVIGKWDDSETLYRVTVKMKRGQAVLQPEAFFLIDQTTIV